MKTKITAFILSVCMVFGLAACATGTGSTGETETSALGKTPESITLRMAGSDVGTPNPFRHSTRGPGIARMQLLYDSLLEKDETGDIPWLAENWEVSEDGKVYTFHLIENAFWHDGKPLTAEDVAFTFAYYKEHFPVSNDLIADGEYIIAGAKVIDDDTAEITLTYFDNTFLTKLGTARILPKHIWENIDDPVAYDGEGVTVGSGPYRLDSYSSEQGAYRYVAFENYWGLTPSAEAIEWVPVSDDVLAFENGEIDIINATADLLPRYESDSQYTIKTVPSLHSYRLMMNMESVSELADVNVRRAIAYAIDRQELINTVARGSAKISSMGYVPTDSAWYNPATQQYEYNPEKAKDLLNGQTYSLSLLTDNTSEGTKTAEMIKIDLAEIGIDVTVESVETKTRDNAVSTGEYELLLINSGGMGGDPDYLCGVYGATAGTLKGWSNDKVFELLNQQATERNAKARQDMIDEVQKIISDDVPMILLFGAVDNFVYRQDKYDGWMCRYDHNKVDHVKLSYLIREE